MRLKAYVLDRAFFTLRTNRCPQLRTLRDGGPATMTRDGFGARRRRVGHWLGRGQHRNRPGCGGGTRRGTRAIASVQLRARAIPVATITSAETFAKQKIFELDFGIGGIVSAPLHSLRLPQFRVAPTFMTAVSSRRRWLCGGAQLMLFAETVGVRSAQRPRASPAGSAPA